MKLKERIDHAVSWTFLLSFFGLIALTLTYGLYQFVLMLMDAFPLFFNFLAAQFAAGLGLQTIAATIFGLWLLFCFLWTFVTIDW